MPDGLRIAGLTAAALLVWSRWRRPAMATASLRDCILFGVAQVRPMPRLLSAIVCRTTMPGPLGDPDD